MAVTLSIGITQNSQSIAANTSNVTVSVTAKWTYGSFNRLDKSGYLIIDGTKYTFATGFNENATTTGSEKIYTKTVNIEHAANGSKTLACSAYYETGGNSGNITATASKTLTRIPRAAELTSAPSFNDEANPVIKYSNPAGSAATTLQAGIFGTNGSTVYAAYRDISKSGNSYTFNLTTAERNALRNAIPNSKSFSVRFYVKTVIGSTTYTSYLTKTFSITNGAPTVSPTITDTNSTTATLTGNANTLIRYFSNVSVAFGASAVKGATIKSRKVTCGNKSLTADGTINGVESGTFNFTVTDSRGYTTNKTVSKSIVNYIKLTCGLANTGFNTEGVISFNVKGNYFNSSFGAAANTLTVEYRYKESGGSYGSWVKLTPSLSGNTYQAAATITGLDYQKKYVIQARAADKLNTISSSEKTLSCIPTFDWSADSFNFNVPVNMNINNNSYSLLGLLYAMTTTYELEAEVTPGANYSNVTATAHLIGGNLRIGISAERNAAVNVGNVTNETVCTLLMNHGGKINNLYRVSFNSSTEGGAATFDAQAAKVDDNTVRVTINLCATTTEATGWNAYFAMPCSIVTKAYV